MCISENMSKLEYFKVEQNWCGFWHIFIYFFPQKAANNTKCKSILFAKAELEEATVSADLFKPVIKKHWRCKFRHVQSLSLRRLSFFSVVHKHFLTLSNTSQFSCKMKLKMQDNVVSSQKDTQTIIDIYRSHLKTHEFNLKHYDEGKSLLHSWFLFFFSSVLLTTQVTNPPPPHKNNANNLHPWWSTYKTKKRFTLHS